MCGRFTFVANPEEVMEEYQLELPFDFPVRYNIAPTQDILTIINDGERNRAGNMRWGLIPFWAKDKTIGNKMINARVETADEKPSFKRLMERRRCLILADSFYEWKKDGIGKRPMRIKVTDRQIFTFAGLWDRWKQGEEELVTCTILTKEANDFMSDIHHRMPVILPKSHEQDWLEFNLKNATDMKNFALSLPEEELEAYEVSQYVNNPRNDDEHCIKALTE
ncbi:SOS response-associated peptidase [Piscibacillus halophilus]|uniref:Abasic site processing protein n=1 Tax=Piscibacillus halophilus TaxID=571933 RepID=A0A1H9GIM3_9BACI|nr:SOS response-associated peptidase [Piscibacillus halophilus]SEQ49931.1 Putative SOS response-associated peptidase YedK [Piscibacillus halophilus]